MATVSRQTVWTTGDTLTAAALNAEFDNILTGGVNNIQDANIPSGAAIAASKISGTAVTQSAAETLTNKTLTSPILTTPRIATGGSIMDENGNEQLALVTTASAVNETTLTNAATGNAPRISASGGDANIHLDVRSKGNAVVKNTTVIQNDTTNSYQNGVFQQAGWGYADVISGTAGITDNITFPIAFTNIYSIVVSFVGYVNTPVTGIASFTNGITALGLESQISTFVVTTTGCTVTIRFSGNLGATTHVGYSWIAIGN